MTRSFAYARDTRGASLVMVLVGAVVAGSLALVALHVAAIRGRLVADARWHLEGILVAESALALTRVAHRADLDTLGDGAMLADPPVVRPDGWSWTVVASRSGAIIRLAVVATRHAADGTTVATRHVRLMLARSTADTVRVLGSRARF